MTISSKIFRASTLFMRPTYGAPPEAQRTKAHWREWAIHSAVRAKLFLRQLPVTTDPGARLLEVVARLGGATSHATRLSPPPGFASPGFNPSGARPNLRACPQQRHPMLTGNG